MARALEHLHDGAAEGAEFLDQPAGGPAAVRGVRRQSADAGDGEEVGELGEEAVAVDGERGQGSGVRDQGL